MEEPLNGSNTRENLHESTKTTVKGSEYRDDNVIEMKGADNGNINTYRMDDHGIVRSDDGAAIAASGKFKTYIILGWISAALTAFISPYFAIAGIVFGVLANKQVKGKGNVIIITNIVFAAINLLFGLFLIVAMRRMMFVR